MSRSWSFAIALPCSLLVASLSLAAEPAAVKKSEHEFRVECRLVDTEAAGKPVCILSTAKVSEHEEATLHEPNQRPFVIAASPEGKVVKPTIAVLPEGFSIRVKCHLSGSKHITLDTTIEQTRIEAVEENKLSETLTIQEPQVEVAKTRLFKTVHLGEPMEVELDGLPNHKLQLGFVVIQLNSK